MRKLLIIFLVLFAGVTTVRAGDQRAQIDAARIAAQANIAEMIGDEPIGKGFTVRDFIARMDAEAQLWNVLSSAQQVGGVRWLDHETCQVRVDVPAIKVGQLLLDLALARPNKTPVRYDQLETTVLRWRQRSFSATASSLTWDRVEQLVPPESARAWQKVDPAQRKTALQAARANAGRQLAQTVRATHDESTPTDSVATDAATQEFSEWVSTQPITSVQFRDDQSVQVALAIEPAELQRRLGEKSAQGIRPIITGEARVETEANRGGEVVIPMAAPRWTERLLDAVGEAQFAGSPLKTARLAEQAAQQQLRSQLLDLDFDGGRSVGETAHLSPAMSAALDRVVSDAKVARVDYHADGSVQVRVTLAGQTIWRDLCAAGETDSVPSK